MSRLVWQRAQRFSWGTEIDDIKKLSPTVLMIMGKLNHDIVNSTSVSPADFASVRLNVTGGSKITLELIDAFKEKPACPCGDWRGRCGVDACYLIRFDPFALRLRLTLTPVAGQFDPFAVLARAVPD
jgi:hypothetical protein